MGSRTPLHDWHVAHGARMVAFAGWDMPVQYEGIGVEHAACRDAVALFDICHMGEIEVSAADVRGALGRALNGDLSGVPNGGARYGLLLNDAGGVDDDIITFVLADDRAIVVTNAANTARDCARLASRCGDACDVRDISEGVAKLDVQGPASCAVVGDLLGATEVPARRFRLCETEWRSTPLLVSRTGYTGEDGFELFVAAPRAVELWEAVLEAGAPAGIRAAGLGARDTLRIEAGLPLYGHELTESTTPAEAGLQRFVAGDAAGAASSPARRLAGLKMLRKSIPREGYEVVDGERTVGSVTSGTLSPTLGVGIAMAYIDEALCGLGRELAVKIRGRLVPCAVVSRPFYKKTPRSPASAEAGGSRTTDRSAQ